MHDWCHPCTPSLHPPSDVKCSCPEHLSSPIEKFGLHFAASLTRSFSYSWVWWPMSLIQVVLHFRSNLDYSNVCLAAGGVHFGRLKGRQGPKGLSRMAPDLPRGWSWVDSPPPHVSVGCRGRSPPPPWATWASWVLCFLFLSVVHAYLRAHGRSPLEIRSVGLFACRFSSQVAICVRGRLGLFAP